MSSNRPIRFLTVPVAILLGSSTPATSQTVGSMAGRSTVYAPHGIVAAPQPLAAQAGLAVLQKGGNAIDAAVTTAAVLNLVEPMMSGIGGDLFAILWSAKERRLVGLNASGRAGSLVTLEALHQKGLTKMPSNGAVTVTVPGALSGWAGLLSRYGTITLARALAPAIKLARDGFPVSPLIAREWAVFSEPFKTDQVFRETFLLEGSHAPRAGEWFRNPEFAGTLERIARGGPAVFYGGALGRQIVARVAALGGVLTLDDLSTHRAEWVDPISVPFKGYRVWELPPNGQGIAALEMLRILEPIDLVAAGHNSAPYLHYLIEAKKIAYADLEARVGDPRFMTATPAELLSNDFIAGRRALIDPAHALDRPEAGALTRTTQTTYLTVADSAGNMISLITSLASGFGSGVVVPGTGFALQNRGVGFSLDPDRPNTFGPGRRPFHTIIPGFVTRDTPNGGEPWLSFGIVGGAQQPQAHVQFLLNMILFGMDPQAALDAARFSHFSGRQVGFEAPIGADVVAALEALGHRRQDTHGILGGLPVLFGGGQAIMRLGRGYAAGSDPRRDGLAAGY